MFLQVGLHTLGIETFVITQTAGISLDLLVNTLSVNLNGDLVVGAEVTLFTLKLFLAAFLFRRRFGPPSLDCPVLLDLNNLTVLSWMSPQLMPGYVVSVV